MPDRTIDRGILEPKSETVIRRGILEPRNFLSAVMKNPTWRRAVSISNRRLPGSRPALHKEKSLKCCRTLRLRLIFWPSEGGGLLRDVLDPHDQWRSSS